MTCGIDLEEICAKQIFDSGCITIDRTANKPVRNLANRCAIPKNFEFSNEDVSYQNVLSVSNIIDAFEMTEWSDESLNSINYIVNGKPATDNWNGLNDFMGNIPDFEVDMMEDDDNIVVGNPNTSSTGWLNVFEGQTSMAPTTIDYDSITYHHNNHYRRLINLGLPNKLFGNSAFVIQNPDSSALDIRVIIPVIIEDTSGGGIGKTLLRITKMRNMPGFSNLFYDSMDKKRLKNPDPTALESEIDVSTYVEKAFNNDLLYKFRYLFFNDNLFWMDYNNLIERLSTANDGSAELKDIVKELEIDQGFRDPARNHDNLNKNQVQSDIISYLNDLVGTATSNSATTEFELHPDTNGSNPRWSTLNRFVLKEGDFTSHSYIRPPATRTLTQPIILENEFGSQGSYHHNSNDPIYLSKLLDIKCYADLINYNDDNTQNESGLYLKQFL